MKRAFLEVTYRKGKPFAAYLSFPRRPGDRASRTEVIDADFNVDYAADGKPIGIEILNPSKPNLQWLKKIVSGLDAPAIEDEDLAPLAVA